MNSIRVKCDIVPQRKPASEMRPPLPKSSYKVKYHRPETKFTPVKLGSLIIFLN